MSEKLCGMCGETKPVEAFNKRVRSLDGLQAYCRACSKLYSRRYCASAEGRETVKQWKHENSSHLLLLARDRRKQNPERLREYERRWYRRNPLVKAATLAAKRARLYGVEGADYTTVEHIKARIALYGGRCYYCSGIGNSIDHRIPLSRGGAHLPANIVPACRTCNSRKGTKTEREYREVVKRVHLDGALA